MSLDFQDQIRFGYVEPDDDDVLPQCPDCGQELTHEPTSVEGDPEYPDLFWTCPQCGAEHTADEVYP